MSGYGEHTVTDLAAGLEHLKRGTASNVDTMLVVAEPYYRSLEAAARTYSLAQELRLPHIFVVANKVKNESDLAAIETFCAKHDMRVIGTVASDESFAEAERKGMAPIDFAPESPGIEAIRRIAVKLQALDHAPATA